MDSVLREFSANGRSVDVMEIEVKLDNGEIDDAGCLICEALGLNFEEARAILGRLEYQRGNIEAALRVFHGVDFQTAVERQQHFPAEKLSSRRARSRGESLHMNVQPGLNLLLEAIYLKAVSLQMIGKTNDAAQECNSLLDAVEKMFQNGAPDLLADIKLQKTISKAVELLPELLKQAGKIQESLAAYRRVLLNQWNLDDESCARIQKRFVVLLLYGGVDANPPSLVTQTDGMFIPENNIEEAIVFLLMLLQKWHLGKIPNDPSVMEHLTYALCLSDQTSLLAKQFEEHKPGTYNRCDRWNTLALCYSGAEQDMVALNLLRKSISKHEKPNDIMALLLATKICSKDSLLSSEGVEYARRAIEIAHHADDPHLVSVTLHIQGICLGKQAKVASSDFESAHLRAEALKSLEAAIVHNRSNPDLIFDLALEYAEHHNMNAALRCAKEFIDATGGSVLRGWKLLALILSAQQRYREAEVVTDAALDETVMLEQLQLLIIKAKLKVAQSLHMDAVETYRILLALTQSKRKSSGSWITSSQIEDKSNEFEIWQGLANLYSRLSHWKDAEICLEKARELKPYSVSPLQTEGYMHEALNHPNLALAAYSNGLQTDGNDSSSKVAIGSLLLKSGSKSLVTARSFLSDALRIEPSNRTAWYYMGMLHKHDGRLNDAADCFQAAAMLDQSEPVESFSSLS